MSKSINIEAIQTKVWLDEEEAAAYVGVSRRYIYSLRIDGTPDAGTLPYQKLGKRILIKRTNIDKYLEQLTVKSTA